MKEKYKKHLDILSYSNFKKKQKPILEKKFGAQFNMRTFMKSHQFSPKTTKRFMTNSMSPSVGDGREDLQEEGSESCRIFIA